MCIPKSLIERVRKRKIVIFAGAGLSINAGLPNWTGLIESILDDLGANVPKKDKLIQALKDEILSPLEILEKIEGFKEKAIESLHTKIRQFDDLMPTEIHKKIGQISTKIITTNYDRILDSQYPNFENVCHHNTFKISKLSNYQEYIFKIHGDIHEPDRCVLFPSQYEDLYNDILRTSVFEFKKIISENSILFIGFSLADPYVKHVFDYVSNVYDGFSPEHYIITTEKKFWPNRITPIILDNYEELDDTLQMIIKEANSGTEITLKEKIGIDSDNIINISEALEYDLPPQNKFWVGRKKELENISSSSFKVIFITGIGGQGKSSLAAYYIKNNFDNELYEFADWRDFKEESNRFQTKLISIIKRITNNRIDSKHLENSNNTQLVDLFFKELGERGIIFVFDNIDSYIDLEEFKPTGGLGYFFEKALEVDHKSKFIFTCRPFIREASLHFYQLKLGGLIKNECLDLFKAYDIPLSPQLIEELSNRTFELTKGHPLWMNLIAAQALRGIDSVNKFIESIEEKTDFNENDFSSILSENILDSVWSSLNDRQKTLLRGVAETVKPETVSDLGKIMESELNYLQFTKAFKVLKNLNLIELKTSTISEEQVELHPLVKEYILSKFPQKERAKYITLLVKYYDSFIYILKPKLNSSMSLSSFQNWTSKIELQINKGDYEPALVALEEVSSSILSAGFPEEYLRVAERLFSKINWSVAIENEYTYFHNQFTNVTTTLTQLGRYQKSMELLEMYSSMIPGKSVYYLRYCSEKCYCLWHQGKHEEAIEIGEEGLFILKESGITENFLLRHNLALAHRDSLNNENIEKALTYFRHGETLETIISGINKDFDGPFYGNVGRCLELKGDTENALLCYYYALSILFKEDNSHARSNIGYGCRWIYNLLQRKGEKLKSLYYLKLSIQMWENSSPPLADQMKIEWDKFIFDKESKLQVDKLSDWKIENYCKDDIRNSIEKFSKDKSE